MHGQVMSVQVRTIQNNIADQSGLTLDIVLSCSFWCILVNKTVNQKDQLQLLVSAFSNAQQDQYEIFRRSTFPKSTIRKLMQGVCGAIVPQNAVIAMAGITKVGQLLFVLGKGLLF